MDNHKDSSPVEDAADDVDGQKEEVDGMDSLEMVDECEEWHLETVLGEGHSPVYSDGDLGGSGAETDSALNQVMANLEAFTVDGDLFDSAMEHYITPLYAPILDAIRSAISVEKLYLAFSKRPIFDGDSSSSVEYTAVMVGTLHEDHPGLLFLLSVVSLDQLGWTQERLFFETIKLLWPENAEVEAAANILLYLSDDPEDFPSEAVGQACPKMIGVNGYEKVLEGMKSKFGHVRGHRCDEYFVGELCEEIDNAIEAIQEHGPLDETLDAILSVFDLLTDWSDIVEEDLYSDKPVSMPDYEVLVDICNEILRVDEANKERFGVLESTAWGPVKLDLEQLSWDEMRHYWFAPLGGINLEQCFPQLDQMLGEEGLAQSAIPLKHVPTYSVVYSNAQLLMNKDSTLILN